MIKNFLPHIGFTNCLRILLSVSLVLIIGHTAYASNDKKLKKAIERYEFKAYTEAIELFKKIVEQNESAYTPLKYLANSYRKVNDYQNAELYYSLVINNDSVIAEDYLYYGQALKANDKLEEAKVQFAKFSETTENTFLGNLMVHSIEEIDKWSLDPNPFSSSIIDAASSKLSEYNMIQFRDKYYITSNRVTNYNSPESFSWNGSPYLSILEIDTAELFKNEVQFEEVGGKLNTDYHDGPLDIDDSESRVIITRIDNQLRGKNFVNRMKLFEGEYVKGKWKNFKPLPFNSNDYHTGHACYADSNTIYFTSDMPGGFGGMDLYVSNRIGGDWGKPVNLGANINTEKNEVFPYVKGNELFYSSNGFAGYGGLDLFVSNKSMVWQTPVNLKSPMNSTRDDFGIYFITDSTGYYSSNRANGKGEDDIYSFYRSSKTLSTGVSGVFEYNSLPVEGVMIKMLDANDSVIAVTYTDKEGRFKFDKLSYQEDYFLQIDTDDNDLYEDGKLFLTNKEGEKISLIERIREGTFKFTALPAEEIELELLAAEDSDLLNDIQFGGQIFKKLPGDYKHEVLVYLVDDEGKVVDSVMSNPDGTFKFTKLALEDGRKYFAQVANEDIDELNLALINQDGRVYEITEAKDGKLYLSNPIDASKSTRIATRKGLTSIIGLVELNGVPLAQTKVLLYNSENQLIATLFTNDKGEFQFNKLAIDESYIAVLPDVEDKENSAVYVINSEGEHLYLINQLREGKFAFKALPYDEYNLIQEEEAANVPDLVEMKGQVYTKLPGDYSKKLKVYLVDDEGDIVDSVYTDIEGRFNFKKLEGDKTFTFRLEEEKDLTLVLLDDNNKVLEETMQDEKGEFVYRKLTYQVAQFEPVKVIDPILYEAKSGFQLYGQLFKKLPGDYKDHITVYLVDDNGKIIDSVITDAIGNFSFSKLGLDLDRKYFAKITPHDNELNLALINNNGRVYEIKEAKDGQFYLSDPIDASKKTKLATNQGLTSIIGLAELNGNPLPNARVLLYNSNHELIATLFTNDKGEFQYNKLHIDESYFAALPDVVDKENSAIYVINSKGDHLYLINQLREGNFAFKALPFDEYTVVQLKEEASVPDFIDIKGQLLADMPGEYHADVPIYLIIDNNNRIIDTAYSDESGRFKFERLRSDLNYRFKIEDAKDITLVLLGEQNQILEQAYLDEDGTFRYRKLTYQVAQFEPLKVTDPELYEDQSVFDLKGQVFKKLPGDYRAGMTVYLYDDNGELVDSVYTDEDGKFQFEKLPIDTKFTFRVEDEKEDYQMVTLDEANNIIEKTIKNKKGEFTYRKLKHYGYQISPEEEEDDVAVQSQPEALKTTVEVIDNAIVYYRFDSTLINTAAMQTLNRFVSKYKNGNMKISVQSHTDNRGPQVYNEMLSSKRTESVVSYLIKKGISKDRIVGKFFGELKPIVDCSTKKCDNNDHLLNRRTELKLIKQ